MEIIYITHHNILNVHALPPGVSWIILIGALYGALRLVIDVLRLLGLYGIFAEAPK